MTVKKGVRYEWNMKFVILLNALKRTVQYDLYLDSRLPHCSGQGSSGLGLLAIKISRIATAQHKAKTRKADW